MGSLKFVINSEIRDFFELPTCSRDETLCMLDQFVVNPTKKKTLDLILAWGSKKWAADEYILAVTDLRSV